jgi:hypothetical protein
MKISYFEKQFQLNMPWMVSCAHLGATLSDFVMLHMWMNYIQIGCNFISHCKMHIQHLKFDKCAHGLMHKATHSSGFRGKSPRAGPFL